MHLARLARTALESGASLHDSRGAAVDGHIARQNYAGLCDYLTHDVAADEIVGIHLPKEPRYLLAICAALETGTAFVPLHHDWPVDRVEQVKAITGCRSIIDGSNVDAICGRVPSSPPRTAQGDGQSTAYVICTSGTTGRPKAVIIDRAAYENFVRWVDAYFADIGEADRVLLTADFTFDMSLLNVALFLAGRGALHISAFKDDVFALASEIERDGITTLVTVPNTMSTLLMTAVTKRFSLRSLQHLLLGGSRFSYGVYQAIREKLPAARCYNLYGPTECTVYATATEISGDPAVDLFDHNVSIGKPILNTTCVLVDDNDREISTPHLSGEVLLGGRQVMTGYMGDPATTARAIVMRDNQRYYRTGDIGFRDARGSYYVTGRLDETLKRRGFRVNLLDVDSYIQRLDVVRECMTIAVPHAVHENLLVSYVVPSEPTTPDALLELLRTILVSYQLPDEIRIVADLPRGSTGKIDRKLLEQRFLADD